MKKARQQQAKPLTPEEEAKKHIKADRELDNRQILCGVKSNLHNTLLMLNPSIAEVEGWKALNDNNVNHEFDHPFQHNKVHFLNSAIKMCLDQRHLVQELIASVSDPAMAKHFAKQLEVAGTHLYQLPSDFWVPRISLLPREVILEKKRQREEAKQQMKASV